MKEVPLKTIILTLSIGMLLVIIFFFAGQFHFQSIKFILQNNQEMAEKYELFSKSLIIIGLVISICHITYEFFKVTKNEASLTTKSFFYNLSQIIDFLFSKKNQEEVFYQIIADWQEEYFEALFKKEIWKARWINVRYTYAFIGVMRQKSPIGDLIEFVIKVAKK